MKTELNSETFKKKRKKYKSISIISLSEDYISLLQILITRENHTNRIRITHCLL